ncbi:hypothetical protein VD0004_g5667 [Verticillium dahliae]|uniref:Uncharacterized protein n=2 Tax=Verticillium dahliae TaxID=27337 RepID=A0A444RMW4_VERDA|nr:hypothetical protein VD0004_g5667 [Verticillium dahliae]RXG42482.1 hypothetical protein VDGE_20629 [Verticillium dahliae]
MLTTAITHELYHHCILYFKPPSAYTLKTLKHVLFKLFAKCSNLGDNVFSVVVRDCDSIAGMMSSKIVVQIDADGLIVRARINGFELFVCLYSGVVEVPVNHFLITRLVEQDGFSDVAFIIRPAIDRISR